MTAPPPDFWPVMVTAVSALITSVAALLTAIRAHQRISSNDQPR